uniref:Uncharacterized protein n=1 Tax=Anguilla anguilla TaxID=7936 RepID=A0A0E9VAA5_ANGAN
MGQWIILCSRCYLTTFSAELLCHPCY